MLNVLFRSGEINNFTHPNFFKCAAIVKDFLGSQHARRLTNRSQSIPGRTSVAYIGFTFPHTREKIREPYCDDTGHERLFYPGRRIFSQFVITKFRLSTFESEVKSYVIITAPRSHALNLMKQFGS